jgi:hypothetical protein
MTGAGEHMGGGHQRCHAHIRQIRDAGFGAGRRCAPGRAPMAQDPRCRQPVAWSLSLLLQNHLMKPPRWLQRNRAPRAAAPGASLGPERLKRPRRRAGG